LFLFRADGVGEIRTLSGTSLTRGVYEELETRGILPDGQRRRERTRNGGK
jgi:hypothetical protein